MSKVLKQGVTVDPHQSQHPERKQRYRGNHDSDGAGHRDHKQDRVSCQDQQDCCFYCISWLQHTAENFAGVGVVCRYGVNVVVFFLFQMGHLPIL